MDAEKNYYVFRISYEESSFKELMEELNSGRLHQGWGRPGMTVLNGLEEFYHNWPVEWATDDKKRRYNQLHIMTEFKKGDIIIVPKTPQRDQFMILEVTAPYYFDDAPNIFDNDGDFRHTVPVETLCNVAYNYSDNSRIVSQKFRAYQSCINNVWNDSFKESVTALIQLKKSHLITSTDELAAINLFNGSDFDNFSSTLKSKVTQWAPHRLEKIVRELFNKNGFEYQSSNHYDKQGGDIDLTFTIPTDNILGNILDLSNTEFDITKPLPEIHIQVKKKEGTDDNAKEGIKQLSDMQDKTVPSIDILINTTDCFSKEDIAYAKGKGILLISWPQFVKLLIKYGCVI